MAKSVHDDVLDAALNYVKTYGDRICVCSAQPTTYTEATSTYELADVTVDSSDYTVGNGDTSGRKAAVAQQTSVTVDSSGTATYVAIVDVSETKLLVVTTCTSQAVTAGNTLTINTFDLEIADPT